MTGPLSEDGLILTYRATIRPLYAFISRRVGGDVSLAEDLAQETWMRALDTWPSRGVPDEPLAWLIRVARNALVSHYRRLKPEFVDPATIDLEAAEFSTETVERATLVGWGLARLRRGHADVLEAFYFDGKSVKEIARERATTERAVEGKLRRARAKLKKQLEKLMRAPASRGRAIEIETEEGRTDHATSTRTP